MRIRIITGQQGVDILKTIEDKMSVGIDMLDIIKQEKLKLEKQIDF